MVGKRDVEVAVQAMQDAVIKRVNEVMAENNRVWSQAYDELVENLAVLETRLDDLAQDTHAEHALAISDLKADMREVVKVLMDFGVEFEPRGTDR